MLPCRLRLVATGSRRGTRAITLITHLRGPIFVFLRCTLAWFQAQSGLKTCLDLTQVFVITRLDVSILQCGLICTLFV